jgi:hypothetical protein
VTYFECCDAPVIENVVYYQKNDRKTVREQCMNCGKRLNRPAISFSKINIHDLKLFDEELSDTRFIELNDIKRYYDELIRGNRGRIRYNLFGSYYYTKEWKELREEFSGEIIINVLHAEPLLNRHTSNIRKV